MMEGHKFPGGIRTAKCCVQPRHLITGGLIGVQNHKQGIAVFKTIGMLRRHRIRSVFKQSKEIVIEQLSTAKMIFMVSYDRYYGPACEIIPCVTKKVIPVIPV